MECFWIDINPNPLPNTLTPPTNSGCHDNNCDVEDGMFTYLFTKKRHLLISFDYLNNIGNSADPFLLIT